MTKKIDFEKLSQTEQKILTQIYGSQVGYSAKKISYVAELDDDEKIFFDKDTTLSPNFFVQRLYKVSGNILPLKFNLEVSRLIEKNDALRTNYCAVDTRTLKIIFDSRSELPEIVYRNLTNVPDIDDTLKNIFEADMRRTFDLRYDNLVRFSVFHTGEEEYAVLITMPKLLENSFDVKNLFRAALGLETLPPTEKKFVEVQHIEPIINYWSKIFQDLPKMPLLPFAKISKTFYQQAAYKMSIPAEIISDLRQKSKSNKIMLMAILQSAWALLLQGFNQSNDVAFSTLIPDRTSEDINSIPVRFKSSGEETLQNLVDAHFKQLLISQPYACKSFSAIKKVLQPQNKTFDHFLSFGDFMKDTQLFSEAQASHDGQLVLQNSWNAQNTKLGIYFNYRDDNISISILYDANKFFPNFGELISRRFYLTLQQMILDWNLNSKTFMERLAERFKAETVEIPTDTSYLRNFISKLYLLQGETEGTIQQLIKISKLQTYFEGDRIGGADIEQNIFFVAEGKLVRSLETGDGWYNTLDIVKENCWLNETVLLENKKAKMSAEILTEKAILMSIPLDAMKKFLQEFPGVEHKILLHTLGEMEKYQRLWIQS